MSRPIKRPLINKRNDNKSIPLERKLTPKREISDLGSVPSAKRPRITEKLFPEKVDTQPAFYPRRIQFLNVIKDKLTDNGYDGYRAIQIEKELAEKESEFTYPMSIRRIVKKIMTKTLDVVEVIDNEPIYRTELEKLLIPDEKLRKAHYIMDVPKEIKKEMPETVTCERCKARFNPKSPEVTTTPCTFHLLRRVYDPDIKKLENVYPCCGTPLEHSNGCEKRTFHVFKLEDPTEMSLISPFRRAPENPDANFAIGLDCEMAYTTWGFEMIRLTMVDYNTRKVVLDEIVKPIGKVMDLNTRFSGVSDLTDAISLDELYKRMFKFIGPQTILLGHGLQNDLNVLRLVHDKIVDTAMLYPPSRTRTFSLKQLAFDYLSRVIQTGEHSSEEDALATIDIVRKDIKTRLNLQ